VPVILILITPNPPLFLLIIIQDILFLFIHGIIIHLSLFKFPIVILIIIVIIIAHFILVLIAILIIILFLILFILIHFIIVEIILTIIN
jgi:hypothetical protein